MSKTIFLDIVENNVAPRSVNVEDITQFLPLPGGGCAVGLRSIGVVRCKQTAEEIANKIMEATKK